ncbi:Predicted DNA-binding protein, MmcQ/YjbR family [Rhizobiales bacterium GAS191]|nr:Predicted DNA-binding protein, MmcQ/YjbR family [Rhizobiales bacterium GAS113]SEC75727.1 Predicted DNA-binding protein, MmcQ/YjbR family [Rhizobiales bacterium GAS191]
MSKEPSERLRAICLALPEATEAPMRRGPSFRVGDKIFATDRRVDDRPSVWCKAPEGSQAILSGADPERFFVPPYFGTKGWVGMWLDRGCDWDEVGSLIRRSYRLVAPKRLAALVP